MLEKQEFKELFVTAVVLLAIDITYLYFRKDDFSIYFLNICVEMRFENDTSSIQISPKAWI